MTSDQVFAELIDEINELKDTDKILLSVLSTMQAVISERIFEKGQDGNDQSIGEYSTKPISIARKNQARQTRRSYFKGGYKEYKGAIGFNNSIVNLVNTGQMRDDWSIIRVDAKTYGLGFKNELNSLKADGNEDHFNKQIFAQSPSEDLILDKTFDVELDRIFK